MSLEPSELEYQKEILCQLAHLASHIFYLPWLRNIQTCNTRGIEAI